MKSLYSLVLCLSLGSSLFAQSHTASINILDDIASGSILVTHSTLDIGQIENAFDGIQGPPVARSANINPLVVTLEFKYTFTLNSTGVYTDNIESGNWTIESAETQADLDNKTGTYRLLIDQLPYNTQTPTSRNVSATGRFLRLTMLRLTGDGYVHLNEWMVDATRDYSKFCMRPGQVRLIPNGKFKPSWAISDDHNNESSIDPIGATWISSNPAIVTVSPDGEFISQGPLGQSTIIAEWNGLKDTAVVKVVNDFESPLADSREVKVAVVIIDPQIPAAGNRTFSEVFWPGLGGPDKLNQQVLDSMFSITDGVLDYKVVETHRTDNFFNLFGGSRLTVDSLYRLFLEPGWTTLRAVSEQQGDSKFQYNELLEAFNLCEKSNNKQIDEVWVWAMPFIGMYETNMTGEGAFWINGPVIRDNDCVDLLTISGFNYQRIAGCALHNFTHRIETSMYRLFGSVRYTANDPPYPAGEEKNALQKFMSYEFIEPGDAHLGNSHFPPNGTENYDYDNLNPVTSFAPNWKRYPYLFEETTTIDCSAWGCERDCGQNYCSWWMSHIPKYKCKDQNGILNNWWTYVVDFNEGKLLAQQTSDCDCQLFEEEPPPPVVCDAKGDFPWHEWIAEVRLGQTMYPSGKSQYSDFTDKIFTLEKGDQVNIAVTAGFSYYTYNEYARVWVDQDRDGIFTAAELINESLIPKPPDGTPTTQEFMNFALPTTLPAGSYTMRVAMRRAVFPEPCGTFDFGEVEDYTLELVEPTSCTLTPMVSNISCSGDRVDFTFQVDAVNGSTSGWIGFWPPFSPTGFPTIYMGQYGEAYDLSVFKGTANSLSLSVSNQGAESCPVSFTVDCPVIPPGQYCESSGDFPWHEWIAGVKLGNLDHTSGKSKYSDFTAQTIEVIAGSPMPISLTTAFSYYTFDEYWKVWIDYDQNGIFDEASETVVSAVRNRPPDGTPTAMLNTTAFIKGGFSQSFTTRMRVSMKRGSYPTPCETLPFGEVEDYSIRIVRTGGPALADLSASNFQVVASGKQGAVIPFTFDLNNTGYSIASGDYSIGAYLSTDQQFSTDDVLVGTIPTGNTPIGTIPDVPGAITVPVDQAEGDYYLILFVDDLEEILESNELNNKSYLPFSVTSGTGIPNCLSQSDFPWEEWIAGVKIGAIENRSGKSPYSDFSNIVFPLEKTVETQLELTTGFSYYTADMFWKIWIDYNQNQIFEESEELFTQVVLPRPTDGTPTAKVVAVASVPATALNGATKMRVSMKKGGFPFPCETIQRGEVEDYTVVIGVAPIAAVGRQKNAEAIQDKANGFQLMPNPAGEEVRLIFGNNYLGENLKIRVMNQIGRIVLEKPISELQVNAETIDLSRFTNGIYQVMIDCPGKRNVTRKLVVARTY